MEFMKQEQEEREPKKNENDRLRYFQGHGGGGGGGRRVRKEEAWSNGMRIRKNCKVEVLVDGEFSWFV